MVRAIFGTLTALVICVAGGTAATRAQSNVSAPPPTGIAADIAVAPEAAELFVAVEHSTLFERDRFDLDGHRLGPPARLPLWRATADVAVNGQTGAFYTAQTRQGRLEIYEGSADVLNLHTWTTGYTTPPVDLLVDDLAAQVSCVLVAPAMDGYRADVMTFSLTGTLQESWSASTPGPATALAREPGRFAYLVAGDGSGGGRLYRFEGRGTPAGDWALAFRPLAVAVGPDDVYVGGVWPDTGRGVLARYGRDGQARSDWPLYGSPSDLDLGPDGTIYALVRRGGGLDLVVEKFTPEGVLLLRWSAISRAFLPALYRRAH